MITEITVRPPQPGDVNFPDHPMSHKYLDGLKGIELGAASHNSYHLAGSINIAPKDDFEFYRDGQVAVNGKYAEVDLWGEAEDLPLKDNTVDYVHSSHAFEHFANPIQALLEMNRVVRDGGYVVMIVPLRDSHPPDRERPLSTWEEWLEAYDNNYTPDTMPDIWTHVAGGRRGHYFVYTIETLKQLIWNAGVVYRFDWELVDSEERDVKVTNGFTLVYKVHKVETPNGDPQHTILSESEPKINLPLPEEGETVEYIIRDGLKLYPKQAELLDKLEKEADDIKVVPQGFGASMLGALRKMTLEGLGKMTVEGLEKTIVDGLPKLPEVTVEPWVEPLTNQEYPDNPEDVTVSTYGGGEETVHIPSKEEAEVKPKDKVHYPTPDEFQDLNPRARWIDSKGRM